MSRLCDIGLHDWTSVNTDNKTRRVCTRRDYWKGQIKQNGRWKKEDVEVVRL